MESDPPRFAPNADRGARLESLGPLHYDAVPAVCLHLSRLHPVTVVFCHEPRLYLVRHDMSIDPQSEQMIAIKASSLAQ